MSITTNLRTIPRAAVGVSLRAARLPVTLAEKATGQQGNESWGPALAFERLEANVESVAGTVFRDPELIAKSKLRVTKLDQLRKAAALETIADQQRAEADETFAARRDQAEKQRRQAEKRAEQREQQIEQQEQRAKQATEQKAAQKKAAARKVQAAQEQAIERRERTVTSEALAKESAALKHAKEAVDAEKTVDVIEDTLEGTAEARKSS